MLDTIESALNHIWQQSPESPAASTPKHARDTFVCGSRAPAAYDPHKHVHAAASRKAKAQPPTPASARPAAATATATRAQRMAAQVVLHAMQVDAFVAQMLAFGSCPTELLLDPAVDDAQAIALQGVCATLPFASLLEAAERDLSAAFSPTALAALADFACTDAGCALLATLPRLQLDLKHGVSLGAERAVGLCHDDQQALLACLRAFDPRLNDALATRPGDVMRQAWTRGVTPDLVREVAAFLQRPEGRAFVDYARRACWLGIPRALVLERDVWIARIQSDMVTVLQQAGFDVPPPAGRMPIFVPSVVQIKEVA